MPGGAADLAHQAEVVDMAMGDDDAFNIIPVKADFMELPLQSKQRTWELGGRVDEGYGAAAQNKHIGADESRESGQGNREGPDRPNLGEGFNGH